ncbi:hypothetical protein NX722_21515 [Endozoicomonas gorgoniicola]|uniref:Putative adhesin Stv domain-containing protein n=1 Tax=Endozoicomonas gorgoniicola TaxID=1234144 RepID=A0ABT3N0K6_9GAMM|nr:hypothetical protein [Endozoicomonas gorgoniicola]MCW7555156.1 hypothetical protein [Endozoicomonas gorgoniicola]
MGKSYQFRLKAAPDVDTLKGGFVLPYTGSKAQYSCQENKFFLFTGRSFAKNKVQNLIIDCDAGMVSSDCARSFSVHSGYRVFFYCPHGSTFSPSIGFPSPLMLGQLKIHEVLDESQVCFDYWLIPKLDNTNHGFINNNTADLRQLYKSIIKNDRALRIKTGEKESEKIYDIILPTCRVPLHRLLDEIKLRFPHYQNIHCMFERAIWLAGTTYQPGMPAGSVWNTGTRSHPDFKFHDPYLPSSNPSFRGRLGYWELVSRDENPWIFIEPSFSTYIRNKSLGTVDQELK